jgi:hypothetical protein
MNDASQIAEAGQWLARSGGAGPTALDHRIDLSAPGQGSDSSSLLHAKHQLLMRGYQARYVLLPGGAYSGSILDHLRDHYDAGEMAKLDALRRDLERELIAPKTEDAIVAAAGSDLAAYAETLVAEFRNSEENPFTAYLRGQSHREHHYRDFLLQSSADLLAEASASALGVVGSFGPPQSALFRILIDEFGYGAHGQKHSVLYQAVMRSFDLDDEYNAYWPLFDTAALDLHNTIHYLFQNPRNFFLQVGFLLFAETAYQRSTADHFRYLREFHPQSDARYFGEHAHIDLHHTRMIIDEVSLPLVAAYGEEVGSEIVAGAELTRAAFASAGQHLLNVSKAFAAAAADGQAVYRKPETRPLSPGLTPEMAADWRDGPVAIQVGGLGVVTSAAVFATFPKGACGRTVQVETWR